MTNRTDPIADRAPDGVNPNLHYLVHHMGWMIWPLGWLLVSALAHHLAPHGG